jgi:hypothetical protein
MHDAPDPRQIVQAVSGYLRNAALPTLAAAGTAKPETASAVYLARVSANLLDIAQRQLAEDAQVALAEHTSLRALLGEDGDLATLNRRLCERIADASLALDAPGLAAHLWRVALDKLAVDQPTYSTYVRVTGAAAEGN